MCAVVCVRDEPPRLRLAHACGSPVVSPSLSKEAFVMEVRTDGSLPIGGPCASEITQLTSSALPMHSSTTDSESLLGDKSGEALVDKLGSGHRTF